MGTRSILLTVLLAVLAVATLAGCGGDEEAGPARPPAPAETQPPPPPPETEPAQAPVGDTQGESESLPPAVEQTRDAVVNAARSIDYDALERLLDPTTFSYSFGESGDPIGYWRKLESEAHVPILGDILPVVLSMPAGKQDDIYVWPAAFAKQPSQWTAEDLEDLRILYSEEDIRSFEQAGGYLGYRVGIREDGTWLFFVAGD